MITKALFDLFKGKNDFAVEKLKKFNEIINFLTEVNFNKSYSNEQVFQLITEKATEGLGISRSSIWLYNADKSGIVCHDLFIAKEKKHSSGIELFCKDFPKYFDSLKDGITIAADDAHSHPATAEFSKPYLTPLKIQSMLDVPIRIRGEMIGVICNEQVGEPCVWTMEDETFAKTLSSILSSGLNAIGEQNKMYQLKESQEELLASEEELRQNMEELEAIQEKLAEELNRVSTLFNSSGLATGILDGPTWIDCNPAFVTLFGAESKIEIIGKTPMDFSPELQLNGQPSETEAPARIEEALTNGKFKFHWLHQTVSAEVFDAEVLLTPFELEGKSYLQVIIVDITEIVEAKKNEIQQKIEIQQKNEELLASEEELRQNMEELEAIQEKLAEELNRVSTLFNSSGLATGILDGPTWVDCNPAFVTLFGAESKADLIGKTSMDVSPELQLNGQPSETEAPARIEEALANGKFKFEWQHKTIQGVVFDAEVLLTPFVLEGKPYLQAVVIDVSERVKAKQAEQQQKIEIQQKNEDLLASEEELRQNMEELEAIQEKLAEELNRVSTLFNSSGLATGILDGPTWIDCNPAFVALFGGENKADLIGKTPIDVSPELQLNGQPSETEAPARIEEALANGKFKFEWQHKTIQGVVFDAEVLLTPFVLEGKPYLQAVVIDVSERVKAKQAEQQQKIEIQQKNEELLASEEELRQNMEELEAIQEKLAEELNRVSTLFNSSGLATGILDGPTWIDCNPAFVTLFGAESKIEIIGKTPMDFSPELQLNGQPSETEAPARIEEALTNGKFKFHWLHQTVNAKVFDAEVLLTPFVLEGRPYLQVIIVDITEMVKAKQVEQQQKIEIQQKNEELLASEEELRQNMEELEAIQEKLAEELNRVSTLFNSSGLATGILNGPTWIDCNPEFCKLFGAESKTDLIGKTPMDVSPVLQLNGKPSETEAPDRIEAALTSGKFKFHWLHQTIQGVVFDAEVLLTPFTLEGRPYLQVIIVDITEMVKAKQAEQQSKIEIQQKNEELLASEEELRQNMEELEATQEQLRIQNAEIEKYAKNSKKQNKALSEMAGKSYGKDMSKEQIFQDVCIKLVSGLGIDRASIWVYNDNRTAIVCENLFEENGKKHSSGLSLFKTDFPKYFEALEREESIIASNARIHQDTSEFTEVYLKPLGIFSMLDIPIRVHGQMIGVICNESLSPKLWNLEDESYARFIASVISIILEAEEKQKIELALHESRERFELAIQGSSDGLWDWDIAKKTIYFAPRWKEMLGYTDEEFENTMDKFWETIHPDDLNRVRDSLQNYLTKVTDKYEVEFRMIHKDGFERWVLAKGSAIFDEHDQPTRMIGFHSDITKRKEAEHKEILNEKMATLGTLMAGLAHEINTPLGAIRASGDNMSSLISSLVHEMPSVISHFDLQTSIVFTEMVNKAMESKTQLTTREERQLKKQVSELLESMNIADAKNIADNLVKIGIYDPQTFAELFNNPEHKEIIKVVTNVGRVFASIDNVHLAVNKCQKMIMALKNYSNTRDFDKLLITDISQSLETVLTLYSNALKHGVEVVRNFEHAPSIYCFEDELNQVWTNLIWNAIQAMNSQGKLTISVRSNHNYLEVLIEDNGPGIPPNIKHKIFDPFFTTKPKGEGTGLGLDICKKIVAKHYGTLSVESEPGCTIFKVSIPYISPLQQKQDEALAVLN